MSTGDTDPQAPTSSAAPNSEASSATAPNAAQPNATALNANEPNAVDPPTEGLAAPENTSDTLSDALVTAEQLAVNESEESEPIEPEPSDAPAVDPSNTRSGESRRTLSVWSARGFRMRMLRWTRQLAHVNSLESTLKAEDDSAIRKRSLALRYRAMAGEKLSVLMPEAYALVREAGRRALSMRHYDVQVIGGISLYEGCIAEMQTG